MSNLTVLIRRTGLAALSAVYWLAWPATGAAQHAEHAQHGALPTPDPGGSIAPVTDADRAAAFPDLDTAHMDHGMLENPLNKLVLLDRLEIQDTSAGDLLRWKLDTWVGRSLNKVWLRSEGARLAGDTQNAELELLWGKGFARWWDFLAGARHDFTPGPERSWAAIGVRGLAPYRFDIEATAYLGDGARTALRLETTYEVLVTNRLILQPRLDLNWYGQSDRARGIGAGLATAELGLRLRYELRREIAPYIGLVRERQVGRTGALVQAAGGDPEDTRLVAGIRLWF